MAAVGNDIQRVCLESRLCLLGQVRELRAVGTQPDLEPERLVFMEAAGTELCASRRPNRR